MVRGDKKALAIATLVVGAVTGIFAFWYAAEALLILKRAPQVKAIPERIALDRLQGESLPTNRHVTLIGGGISADYLVITKNKGREWSCIYAPVLGLGSNANVKESKPQIFASISNIRDKAELSKLHSQSEITGCIWEDFSLPVGVRLELVNRYPDLNVDESCLFVVGKPIPSIAKAKSHFVIAAVMGVAFVGCIFGVWCLLRPQSPSCQISDGAALNETCNREGTSNLREKRKRPYWFAVCHYVLLSCLMPLFWVGLFGCITFVLVGRTSLLSHNVSMTCLGAALITSLLSGALVIQQSLNGELYDQEEIPSSRLPTRVKQFFDRHSKELELLGFTMLGDYYLRTNQLHMSRQFLSNNKQVIGLIEYSATERKVNLISITSEDWYFATSNRIEADLEQTEYPIRYQYKPGNLSEQLVAHQEFLRELEKHSGSPARRIEESKVIGVLDYGNQLTVRALGSRKKDGQSLVVPCLVS